MRNCFQTPKEKHPYTKRILIPILIFSLLLFLFLLGVRSVSESSQKEQIDGLKTSVLRNATHCYAVEGRYPESLSYLEQHYGITYDHSRYLVDYEVIGSNLPPSVTVISLSKEGLQ